MKLTLQMQVLPTADQKPVLLETMERFNAARNIGSRAWAARKTASELEGVEAKAAMRDCG